MDTVPDTYEKIASLFHGLQLTYLSLWCLYSRLDPNYAIMHQPTNWIVCFKTSQ